MVKLKKIPRCGFHRQLFFLFAVATTTVTGQTTSLSTPTPSSASGTTNTGSNGNNGTVAPSSVNVPVQVKEHKMGEFKLEGALLELVIIVIIGTGLCFVFVAFVCACKKKGEQGDDSTKVVPNLPLVVGGSGGSISRRSTIEKSEEEEDAYKDAAMTRVSSTVTNFGR